MRTYSARITGYGRLPSGRPFRAGDVLTGLTEADVRVLRLCCATDDIREESAADRLAGLNAKETAAAIARFDRVNDVRAVLDAELARPEPRATVIRAAERRLRALGAGEE